LLRIGSSPGLVWEIDQSLVRLPRRRLFLSVLGESPLSAEVAARLAPVAGDAWADALPLVTVRPSLLRWLTRLKPSDRRIGALVSFPNDLPRVFPVVRWRAGVDGLW
jgi:hypothetical protein